MLTRREFLMQAHTLRPDKDKVSGWWISEKLDGTRCFWDGGISRGVPTVEVPWANIFHPKTGKLKTNLKQTATGLWSRYANPIIAPDSFLNQLPTCFLDGELFAGNGNFQLCRSIVAGNTPGTNWGKITYCVYGSPAYKYIFASGKIKGPQMVRDLYFEDIDEWIKTQLNRPSLENLRYLEESNSFDDELSFLHQMVGEGYDNETVHLHPQRRLPSEKVKQYIETFMGNVLDGGGEGIVLRSPSQVFEPKRKWGLLKCKPTLDAEAVITGFTSGAKTDKGSKYLGMIGALITKFNGKRLELSGLNNKERGFISGSGSGSEYAKRHPGEDMPVGTEGKCFKVGDTITFKYREMSDEGIPKEARFWRKR